MSPAQAVFERSGESFVPTEHALSPWGSDRLHGGAVLGLLTRAIEEPVQDLALHPTRLTFDQFRAVPRVPLTTDVHTLREGARLLLLQAHLRAGGDAVARCTALFLRENTNLDPGFDAPPRPSGPDGLETTSLMRGFPPQPPTPPGFHTAVETRWLAHSIDEPVAIWFHLPMPLVAGEQASSLQLATAIADLGNAVASIAAREAGQHDPSYINAETTLYLLRRPIGEWFCLVEERIQDRAGISVATMAHCDRQGLFGRTSQARLSNAR